jgi:hypothetical protein
MLAPLTDSLESFPTFTRVVRFLQAELTHDQLGEISQRINHYYKATFGNDPLPRRRTKRLSGKKPKKKVVVYPVDFLPTMIKMVQDYQKEIKPKRTRIKIAPQPIRRERRDE